MKLEDKSVAAPYRDAYREGVERVLAERRREADRLRAAYVTPESMAKDPERYRRDLADLLGWPLNAPRPAGAPGATLLEEKPYAPGVVMRRVQLETLPGLPFYGLLFTPEDGSRRPLVIAQHGGGGTPELAADLYGENNYRHLIARLLDAGCAVFAPQLLLWNEKNEDIPRIPAYGQKNNRDQMEKGLCQAGGSIVALEVYSITRALDWLTTLPEIDADRIGMIGLSYGGLYTQLTAAMDTRIRAAVSNAFFNDRYAYCWHDFCWRDSALKLRDAEICGLIAPRAFCAHVGRQDHVFSVETALPEMERLRPYFEARGAADKLKLLVSEANHTLCDSGEEMQFLLDNL